MTRQPVPAPAWARGGDPRWSEQEYRREYDRIRTAYGFLPGQPNAERDKALARLLERCGWAQKEIGSFERAEGRPRSQPWLSQHLCFGKFLHYAEEIMAKWPQGALPQTSPLTEAWLTLSEGRFRKLWKETDKDHDDDDRFAAVLVGLGEPSEPKPAHWRDQRRRTEAAKAREAEARTEHLDERMAHIETTETFIYRWRDDPEETARRMVEQDRDAAQHLMLALQTALAESANDNGARRRRKMN